MNNTLSVGDATAGAAQIEIGQNRSADGASYIDFISDSAGGVDYDARILRNSGTNGTLDIINDGSGNLRLLTTAGYVSFGTHAAIAAETLSGYITITDAGGTTRKIGVIS
tara:strand:- start:161 stop:490 length:330 start_codon:yes stop_codon:yes gene_type:complete